MEILRMQGSYPTSAHTIEEIYKDKNKVKRRERYLKKNNIISKQEEMRILMEIIRKLDNQIHRMPNKEIAQKVNCY